jgi:hypothetical protein
MGQRQKITDAALHHAARGVCLLVLVLHGLYARFVSWRSSFRLYIHTPSTQRHAQHECVESNHH